MKKIILSTLLALGCLSSALPAGECISVPAEYIPLNNDYSHHFSELEMVDPDARIFRLSNGSEWEVMGPNPETVVDHMRRWNECDWIHFCPGCSKTNQWRLCVENRSLGDRVNFNAMLIGAPLPESQYLYVQDVQILPSGHAFLILNNGDSWIIPDYQALIVQSWQLGDPVMIDVIEEFDFGSGTFIIRDMLFIINLGSGIPEGVRGIVIR